MVIVLAAALTGTFAVLLTQTMQRDQGIALDAVGQSAPNSTAHIPLFTINKELAGLSNALSGMTSRLLAKDEVEERVRLRTAELEAANSQLATLARHDPLTGLLNRRAFEEAMADAIANAKRHPRLVSLLVIDADYFKRINDRFGHAVADEVLKKLADFLRARLRLNDVVARVGCEAG